MEIKKIISVILVVLAMIVLIVSLIGCSSKKEGTSVIGTIKTPIGTEIKVTFIGPPELEDKWTKVGMADPYRVQLIGTVTNKSATKSFVFKQISFLFDGQQTGVRPGTGLFPGQSIKITWEETYPPNAKTLGVRVVVE